MSRPNPVTVHLPQPCHESWSQMNPVAATERHCVACQDVVVDFTQMSDAEVVTFLARRPEVTCGRFTETQLDRPLRGLPEPAPRWRTWLATTAVLLGL
ncbi:hypothetical protein [Hymenobacter norwichensis]|uniref:hypothetical protein n=1 Tax=Hymenobacter norwichensis TaxID=223903 RepID=UPI0012F8C265|nr:hypothetical protein [Hymenobacter norwichensis]